VVNTATVTGTPLNPADSNNPFPAPNPPVKAVDSASVTLVDPDLTLSKAVDQPLVFPGTTVTYTYQATNEGDADLRNDTGDPGWVTDDKCSPVAQVLAGAFNVGDANTDTLLNPGETWRFTCSTPITADTVNTATIVAQPVDENGDPVGDELTRQAPAVVLIVDPGIAITKTALVPVVLDPGAGPFRGPDTPTPRPARYLYEVSNTGEVPLAEVAPPADDQCDAVTFVEGDADDVLDVGEVWVYTCQTTLDREGDANTPPVTGAESGVVTNTATVSGTPFLPDDPTVTGPLQTAEDTAQVQVIEPGITLTKTASDAVVLPGQDVTYTIGVTNTGDVGLDLIGPVDDECTDLTFVSGDRAPANGLLDGANSGQPETWIYTCARAIGLPAPPETSDTNTASVIGVDPLGNAYRAEDTAQVQVIDPAIALTKAVNAQLVPAGTDVTYTFDVTNAGGSPARRVRPTHAQLDDAEGTVGAHGVISVGAVWSPDVSMLVYRFRHCEGEPAGTCAHPYRRDRSGRREHGSTSDGSLGVSTPCSISATNVGGPDGSADRDAPGAPGSERPVAIGWHHIAQIGHPTLTTAPRRRRGNPNDGSEQ
jgi:hypothetical protein